MKRKRDLNESHCAEGGGYYMPPQTVKPYAPVYNIMPYESLDFMQERLTDVTLQKNYEMYVDGGALHPYVVYCLRNAGYEY